MIKYNITMTTTIVKIYCDTIGACNRMSWKHAPARVCVCDLSLRKPGDIMFLVWKMKVETHFEGLLVGHRPEGCAVYLQDGVSWPESSTFGHRTLLHPRNVDTHPWEQFTDFPSDRKLSGDWSTTSARYNLPPRARSFQLFSVRSYWKCTRDWEKFDRHVAAFKNGNT